MPIWSRAQAQERFAQLDQWLTANRAFWQPQPFKHIQLGWEQDFPELASWLRRRNLQQAEQAHLQPWLLDAPPPFNQLAAEAVHLSEVPQLPQQKMEFPTKFAVHVPGRKHEQLLAFRQSMIFSATPQRWLDWCGGKGYLARHLAYPQHSVACLEWQQQLCLDGAKECQDLEVPVSFHQLDAFGAGAAQLLQQSDTWVALHACGDLHTHLLRQAPVRAVKRLAISPCCYNRTESRIYQTLSRAAEKAQLSLLQEDLTLVMQASVTASARDKRLRDHSMAWRLGFDLLQRQVSGNYLPVPSIASKWLKLDFASWCQQVAELKGINLPDVSNWQLAEAAGWKRLALVRNLELVQGLFRRPLEIWLLLDQLLFLQESGYQVRFGSFCQPQLSPRNLALIAEQAKI